MIDARTLLLAEQAQRDIANHAAAELLREAAREITGYRTTLRLARTQLAVERAVLADRLALKEAVDPSRLADLDAVLAHIDEALK